jgi:hypothetical protein
LTVARRITMFRSSRFQRSSPVSSIAIPPVVPAMTSTLAVTRIGS